jgi:hypothetical protein
MVPTIQDQEGRASLCAVTRQIVGNFEPPRPLVGRQRPRQPFARSPNYRLGSDPRYVQNNGAAT